LIDDKQQCLETEIQNSSAQLIKGRKSDASNDVRRGFPVLFVFTVTWSVSHGNAGRARRGFRKEGLLFRGRLDKPLPSKTPD
jgi:hypothetical protein